MEYLYLIIIIITAIICGIFTGLLPGIHINMVSMLILVNTSYILTKINLELIIIFIIVMGVTHSFIDFIPSILFGLPDIDTNLSILPAHQMVLNGEGYKAIFYSSIGSLFGMFFSIIVIPFFYFGLKIFYSIIKNYIPIILILVIITLVSLEKNKNDIFWTIIVILFSGATGMLILNSNILISPLLVLFTGIFATSTIINSCLEKTSKLPTQNFNIGFKFNKKFFKSIIIAGITSSIASISPGIGNSQAATISTLFFKDITSKYFIVTTSAINTINFILSFLTFYLIQKARNGSVFVISQITQTITIKQIIFYFIIIFIVSIIGFFITLILGKKLIKILSNINFKIINISILILLFLLIYFISGIYGILILILTTSLGLFTILINVKRVHLMNVLLIPVIFNLI